MPLVDENEIMIPEIIDRIRASKIKVPEEKYIIITPRNPTGSIEVYACSVSSNGEWENLGSFVVAYSPKK